MAAKEFQLKILSSDKKIFEGEVTSLVVCAEGGYLGVLANHAPLITNLITGKILVKNTTGTERTFELTGKGFLKVFKNFAVILLDSIKPPA